MKNKTLIALTSTIIGLVGLISGCTQSHPKFYIVPSSSITYTTQDSDKLRRVEYSATSFIPASIQQQSSTVYSR